MTEGVEAQRKAMDEIYSDRSKSRWAFHYTDDPLIRYLRDRRMRLAMDVLQKHGQLDPTRQSVLVVCGGIGGEGTFLANFGFVDVTVSDLSTTALETCRRFDPRLKTKLLNTEDMREIENDSYDIVIVQDGLHHLPRPALGFAEMLRVARVSAILIEPHCGLVGKLLGTVWEVNGDAVNYVFRWNRVLIEQVTLSYLLRKDTIIEARRVWDHNLVVSKAVARLPERMRLRGAQTIYGALRGANRLGNMMVGVVIKGDGPTPARLASH